MSQARAEVLVSSSQILLLTQGSPYQQMSHSSHSAKNLAVTLDSSFSLPTTYPLASRSPAFKESRFH